MKRLPAALIAVLLAGLAYAFVVWLLGDAAFWSTAVPPGRDLRAALAIRDRVPPFQQWGSEMFTRRYLSRYYAESWYFTQPRKGALKKQFVASLNRALERYPNVDLFLLAHTNEYVKWVAEIPAERRAHLRLVYNTGCHNQPQGPQWLDLGAKTYIGHPGTTWSPFFYFFFLRRWTRGGDIENATLASNALMENKLKLWERMTFGHWNAAALMYESKASSCGRNDLRIAEGGP